MELSMLGDALQGLGAVMKKNITSLKKEVSKSVATELIRGTPADTGQARSNWIVSSGEPDNRVLPAYEPGKHLGLDETANANAAIEEAINQIEHADPNADIIIQNNLPYIDLLNNGSSTQAPANFVEKAVQAGEQKIQQANLLDEGAR